MAKPPASKPNYQQEATTRVLTMTAIAIVSAALAALIAWLITLLFPNVSHNTRANIFGYTALGAFAIICGTAVYQADKKLNRRFNQNP